VAPGAKGPAGDVKFDFGDSQPLALPANGDGHFLEVGIPTQILGIFLTEVAERPMAVLLPKNENEGWFVTSNGSKAAVQAVTACMQDGS
jgi:hypothetical protein